MVRIAVFATLLGFLATGGFVGGSYLGWWPGPFAPEKTEPIDWEVEYVDFETYIGKSSE